MDLSFIKDLYIPIVLVICLCVGYVIKNFLPSDSKWIPLIMTILGGALACIAQEQISIYTVGAGMVTGLASTGLHQVFKQLIFGEYVEDYEDDDQTFSLLEEDGLDEEIEE